MPDWSIELTRRSRFLSSHRAVTVSISFAARNGGERFNVGFFLEELFKGAPDLIPRGAQFSQQKAQGSAPSVLDLRGRPGETFAQPPSSLQDREHRREELFFAAGEILPLPAKLDRGEELPEPMPWSFQICTAFDSFPTPQHIAHRLETTATSPLRELLPRLEPHHLARMMPLSIASARIGLEFYRSRFRGSMLSFAAGIEERLYLEIHPAKAYFRLSDDALPGGVLLPLAERQNVLWSLSQAAERGLGVPDLSNRLTSLAAQNGPTLSWSSTS